MSQTVVGIFNSADEARNAVDHLLNNGFGESNVDYASGSGTYANEYDNNNNRESGISRFFKNLFGNDDESDRYSRVAKRGHIVTVHAQSTDEARRASELLDEYGAVNIDENDNEYKRRYGNMTGTNDLVNTSDTDDLKEGSKTIPVIEENLQVGKRVVETGGVRLRSRIIEKPVEETIRLREEHVSVNRNKVDRPVTSDELDNLREETLEVRERAEIPVVNKEATVVEEVSIDKTVDHREETIKDNVRRQDVEVEDLDDNYKRNNR
jgi:stress response protein YsnF